ncbi:hypothetical protein ANTPLA_LOCUS8971 [Anthophora plagiata]
MEKTRYPSPAPYVTTNPRNVRTCWYASQREQCFLDFQSERTLRRKGNSLQDARSPSLPALLATSGKEERAWTMERNSGMEANRRAGTTLRNVFVNIHPTHEARAARVAVNPGTLILMRLRHVQHTRALYSAGSPRRRKHESSTEFTTPSVYRT